MQWAKTLDKKKVALVLMFIAVFLAVRLPGIGTDTINPDAVNWHYRSEQFVVGLKHFILEKTYQHYHPGVTLMWVAGIPIEITKQITNIETYDQFSFTLFHYIARYSLIMVQLGLTLFVFSILKRFIGFEKSLLAISILSFEPFFVGNSRLFHMDILFTLLVFSTLGFSYLYMKDKRLVWIILAGIFSGLCFLTRSLGLGVVLYVIFGGGLMYYLSNMPIKKILQSLLYFLIACVSTVVLFFPALWDKPVWTITNIFTEGQRIGVRNGHSQIFLGNTTQDPGALFYPVVLSLKMSPFILVGVVLFLVFNLKNINKAALLDRIRATSFTIYSTVFYLGYFVVMTLPTKKIDRYMLTLFPFFALLASLGYYKVFESKRRGVFFTYATGILFALFVFIPVISYHPYNFTYTNPLFGSPAKANSLVGQKSFGVGIYEVKQHLQKNYGSSVEVGFIDTKPLKSIYSNSLVSDIRIDGTSNYDVLVLAINEEFPENVLKSGVTFRQDSSLYINGLEYWRFYVKESK